MTVQLVLDGYRPALSEWRNDMLPNSSRRAAAQLLCRPRLQAAPQVRMELQQQGDSGDRTRRIRTFADLGPLMKDCYPAQLVAQTEQQAYESLESTTRANVTIVPPWPCGEQTFCGSTLGHYQYDPADAPNAILEIYEVISGCGALLIDEPGHPHMDLYLLRPGDKVGTPHHCVMTIFCLGDLPLVLHDIADPQRHRTHKLLQREAGPTVVMHYGYGNLRAEVNPRYVDRQDGFGARAQRTAEPIALPVDSNSHYSIYNALAGRRAADAFSLRGIRLRRPNQEVLAGKMGLPVAALESPLCSLRKDDDAHPLMRYLFRKGQDETGLVAVVGGGGDVATHGLQPAIAGLESRMFVCLEQQPEPSLPHAYRKWHTTTSLDDTVSLIASGRFASVHLSSPPKVTSQLLGRLTHAPVELMTAEKPWFNNAAEAKQFAAAVENSAVKFRFWDHYLERSSIAWLRQQDLQKLLGGAVSSVEFQLYEATPASTPTQVQTGALRDLAVHGASIVRALFHEHELRVTQAGAARIDGAPGTAESFAWMILRGTADAPLVWISAGKQLPVRLARKRLLLSTRLAGLEVDLAADTIDLVSHK
jgi:hypothetical protein